MDRRSDIAMWVGVGIAVVLGAIVREAACRHALPYIIYGDEYAVAGAAIQMMKERSLDPHFYGYGALLTYATLALEIPYTSWLQTLSPDDPRALASLDALSAGAKADGMGPESTHPELYYAARLLIALMGTLTILTSAAMARRMGGRVAAVVAAFALAGATAHVSQSGFSVPNVPLAFLASIVVLKTLDWVEEGRGLWVAALVAGLAFACKITGILVTIVPLAAVALAYAHRIERRVTKRDLLAVLAIPPIIFLLGNPFFLYKPAAVLSGLAIEMHAYYDKEGTPTLEAAPGLGQLRFQMGELAKSFGWFQLSLGFAGLVALVRRKNGWVVWLLPLVVLVFFATPRATFHRNLITAYPFLAAGVGIAVATIARMLPAPLALASSTALLAIVAARSIVLDAKATVDLPKPDTRTAIVDELARYPNLRVGIPDEIRLHSRDRAKLPHGVGGALIDLACSDQVDVVVVPLAFWSWYHPATAALLNEVLPPDGSGSLPPVEERWSLGSPADRIALRVVPVPFDECKGLVPFGQLENVTHYPSFDSTLAMLWNGPVALAGPTPEPGRYEVTWEVRGISKDAEPARVRLVTPTDSSEEALTSDWQFVKREFDVTPDTDLRGVRLEFLNDGGTPETDKDVAIGRVWLRRI